MGLSAAIMGGVIAFILNIIMTKIGLGAEEAIQNFFMNRFADAMDPDQLEQMQQQFEASATMSARLINGLIGLVVTAVFGAIGGAIGAAVFKKGTDAEEVPPAPAV